MGRRIVTIDSSNDSCGTLQHARSNHQNAILTDDVSTFVSRIKDAIGTEKISQLDIIGHGTPGQVIVGGGTVHCDVTKVIGVNNTYNLFNYNLLSYLRGCFDENAVVRIHACRVALGTKGNVFLWQLADLWKVRVQGAFIEQFPDRVDHFEGRYYLEANGNSNLGTIIETHQNRRSR